MLLWVSNLTNVQTQGKLCSCLSHACTHNTYELSKVGCFFSSKLRLSGPGLFAAFTSRVVHPQSKRSCSYRSESNCSPVPLPQPPTPHRNNNNEHQIPLWTTSAIQFYRYQIADLSNRHFSRAIIRTWLLVGLTFKSTQQVLLHCVLWLH